MSALCKVEWTERLQHVSALFCSPRRLQRDLPYPRPVQSLPPLRAFLRNEGINADIETRHSQLIGTAHEAAREEARRRALKAAATRYVFSDLLTPLVSPSTLSRYSRSSPPPGHEHQQLTYPFGGVRMLECHNRLA